MIKPCIRQDHSFVAANEKGYLICEFCALKVSEEELLREIYGGSISEEEIDGEGER